MGTFARFLDLVARVAKAFGLLFLAVLVIAAPIAAFLEWGLPGLLSIVAIFAAWHGGMVWQSIRQTPNGKIVDAGIFARLRDDSRP